MAKQTIIPFGPQHPVLPEPVHLDLVLEDETVVTAIPSIGFIHRGLEKLVEKKEYTELMYVTERICGICAFGHNWGYCQAIEYLMGVEVPERAEYLRTLWHEMSRVHSHLLWLGLLADAFGFESLFYHCWRLRERVLDLFEKTTGGRVIFSVNKIGGVHRDITPEVLAEISATMTDMRAEVKEMTEIFINDISVKNRLVGVGYVSKEDAADLCAVGPTARGSGVVTDIRLTGHGVYGKLDFEPCIEEGGDCYARTLVRIRELLQSMDMVVRICAEIPEGEIAVAVKGKPEGEFMARLEQPRGEACYYVKGNGSKNLDRMRVRTPTNINIPFLVKSLEGAELADVPVIVICIDPCISCTER